MKIARYAVVALGLIAFLTPRAKADTFVYNVTSTDENLDVTFDEPTFQEVVTTTSFVQNTSDVGPLTGFQLSGNSTKCTLGATPIGFGTGPCFFAATSGLGGIGGFATTASPSFTGPGTFTTTASGVTTTVTITDVPSAAPEPGSVTFIAIGFGALRLMRKRMGRPSAV